MKNGRPKRLCAPSPRLGLTRRGLSLRLRSNGALAAASNPHQAPGRRLAAPRSSVRRLRTPGHALAAGADREVVLPSRPLCRLTGTRGDGRGASRNVRPTLRTISLPAECKAWAARWPLDRLRQSVNSRLGRWKIRKTNDPAAIGPSLPGWDWSSFAGAGKQDGWRRRTRRRDGPTASGSWFALQVVSLGQVE